MTCFLIIAGIFVGVNLSNIKPNNKASETLYELAQEKKHDTSNQHDSLAEYCKHSVDFALQAFAALIFSW